MVHIIVDTPRVHEDTGNMIASFRVQIQDSGDQPLFVCRRSLADFETLRKLIVQENPCIIIDRPPKLTEDPTSLEACRESLEKSLNAMAVYPSVLTSLIFQQFLKASYDQWIAVAGTTSHDQTIESIANLSTSTLDPSVDNHEFEDTKIVSESLGEMLERTTNFMGEVAMFRAWLRSSVDALEDRHWDLMSADGEQAKKEIHNRAQQLWLRLSGVSGCLVELDAKLQAEMAQKESKEMCHKVMYQQPQLEQEKQQEQPIIDEKAHEEYETTFVLGRQ